MSEAWQSKYRYFTGGCAVKDERRFDASYERPVRENAGVVPLAVVTTGWARIGHTVTIGVVSNGSRLSTSGSATEAPNSLTDDPYRSMINAPTKTWDLARAARDARKAP
jgi:hypothetical protein